MLGLGKMRVIHSQGFGGKFVIKTRPKIKEVRLIQGNFLTPQSGLRDPNLRDEVAPECLKKFGEIADSCLRNDGIERPVSVGP